MSGLVLSLFPGLDLLGMAFEQEGFCVVSGPDVVWGCDVREFHPPTGKFDGVIGGPPCQTFSALANLVRAKGLEPRFGNLIPEFVRCVEEAAPRWWLMENVPGVPEDDWPEPAHFAVHSFVLDNAWLPGSDGFGQEQMRKRRFWFGKPGELVDLRQWIQLAALELPMALGGVVAGHGEAPGTRDKRRAITQNPVNNAPEKKVPRARRQAVTHRADPVPVKFGGSGKVKRSAVTGRHDSNGMGDASKPGAHAGNPPRYTLADMLRLQGLPEDALDEAPFTMHGKRKLVGNGVPIAMGRALARAVKEATDG